MVALSRRVRTRPLLLDLFCGAGGAAMGYYRAGFEVVGVDVMPQPRYPFEFHQADALTYPLRGFDAIHASPPCQHYSSIAKGMGYADLHPDLVAKVRKRLRRSHKPWVMENVIGAPFDYAVRLCGTQFPSLGVYRHRLFETSVLMFSPGPCCHKRYKPIGVYGATVWDSSKRGSPYALKSKPGEWRQRPGTGTKDQASTAMDINWMSLKELTQAIPPAYTEWIGRQLLAVIEGEAVS